MIRLHEVCQFVSEAPEFEKYTNFFKEYLKKIEEISTGDVTTFEGLLYEISIVKKYYETQINQKVPDFILQIVRRELSTLYQNELKELT